VSKSTAKIWHAYPVSLQREDRLLILGKATTKILAKISAVKIEPTEEAKLLTNKSKIY